jgi:hypothetical protein
VLISSPKANYKVSTSKERKQNTHKQNTKQGNLYNLNKNNNNNNFINTNQSYRCEVSEVKYVHLE